jgi:hypothetical protein
MEIYTSQVARQANSDSKYISFGDSNLKFRSADIIREWLYIVRVSLYNLRNNIISHYNTR